MQGCDTLLLNGDLQQAASDHFNMIFAGEYDAPADLPEIYSRVHFNWCVDLSDGDNSRG